MNNFFVTQMLMGDFFPPLTDVFFIIELINVIGKKTKTETDCIIDRKNMYKDKKTDRQIDRQTADRNNTLDKN